MTDSNFFIVVRNADAPFLREYVEQLLYVATAIRCSDNPYYGAYVYVQVTIDWCFCRRI